jgi:hypothetical protein
VVTARREQAAWHEGEGMRLFPAERIGGLASLQPATLAACYVISALRVNYSDSAGCIDLKNDHAENRGI